MTSNLRSCQRRSRTLFCGAEETEQRSLEKRERERAEGQQRRGSSGSMHTLAGGFLTASSVHRTESWMWMNARVCPPVP